MGWLSDNLQFEKFHFNDMMKRIRDDPKRLILGVDPFSTGVWNKALGRDDEPIMNQLGGPMGGGTLGMDNVGGVYDRAGAAGINTQPAGQTHDVAEIIASMFGAQGAMQGFGNIGGGKSNLKIPGKEGGGGGFMDMFMPQGGEGGWQQYAQMGGGMPGMGGQQPQQPPPAPMRIGPSQYAGVNTQMMSPKGLLDDDDERLKQVAMMRGLL